MSDTIGIVGAGRMGRGIALSYIFAGVPVLLVDLKERSAQQREQLAIALVVGAGAEVDVGSAIGVGGGSDGGSQRPFQFTGRAGTCAVVADAVVGDDADQDIFVLHDGVVAYAPRGFDRLPRDHRWASW